MNPRLATFVRELYFDLQTIEGVQPLEIWNGFREQHDPFEKAALVKNLYKIAVPLVNEACFGLPYEEHARAVHDTVRTVLDAVTADMDGALYGRFPWPPTGEADQKALYKVVQQLTAAALAARPRLDRDAAREAGSPGASPESLFDFREMRIVDNELPYIIFTDKEYKVIHGIAVVYLWLIDFDGTVLRTFEETGMDPALTAEFREVERLVQKDNPFAAAGRMPPTGELMARVRERLATQDYLDLFEGVYAWFEQARTKLLG